ncbi:MAG TPA: hypothetical protein VI757_16025 [Bacteroidia bacterium]|nr:hypothetical protein [Bacteroidia bacterium]
MKLCLPLLLAGAVAGRSLITVQTIYFISSGEVVFRFCLGLNFD